MRDPLQDFIDQGGLDVRLLDGMEDETRVRRSLRRVSYVFFACLAILAVSIYWLG
jgi:hypothetical protein